MAQQFASDWHHRESKRLIIFVWQEGLRFHGFRRQSDPRGTVPGDAVLAVRFADRVRDHAGGGTLRANLDFEFSLEYECGDAGPNLTSSDLTGSNLDPESSIRQRAGGEAHRWNFAADFQRRH